MSETARVPAFSGSPHWAEYSTFGGLKFALSHPSHLVEMVVWDSGLGPEPHTAVDFRLKGWVGSLSRARTSLGARNLL